MAIGLAIVSALCVASGAEPFYDPWAWLIWGEEVAGLDLDTTAGPSWKPFPVAVTALASVAGDAAPRLWLIIAWAGWFAAPLAAAALALRLVDLYLRTDLPAPPSSGAGPRVRLLAGALAAVGVVLLHDGITPWLRQGYGGLSEPLLVALVLVAIERELAGRSGVALALAGIASLLRPEAWPFALAYAIWVARRAESRRRGYRLVALAATGVAAAWFIPDLLAAGNPFEGAGRARAGEGEEFGDPLDVLGRAAVLPLGGLSIGAVIAAAGRHTARVLLAGALAWVGIVAALSLAGFGGLPRFMAPAAALVCVLGGLGVAIALTSARRPGARGPATAVAGLAIAIALQGAVRAAELPDEVSLAHDRSRDIAHVRELVESVGAERILACAPEGSRIAVTHLSTQTAFAWALGVPIVRIQVHADGDEGAVILAGADATAVPEVARGAELAGEGRWALLGPGC